MNHYRPFPNLPSGNKAIFNVRVIQGKLPGHFRAISLENQDRAISRVSQCPCHNQVAVLLKILSMRQVLCPVGSAPFHVICYRFVKQDIIHCLKLKSFYPDTVGLDESRIFRRQREIYLQVSLLPFQDESPAQGIFRYYLVHFPDFACFGKSGFRFFL